MAAAAQSNRPKASAPASRGGLLKVGDLLVGKYRVERVIGKGGMGVVVAAHHELLDQHVAVKLLDQNIADREAQSRLLLEARACAKLQSEHVARVVDVDTGADGLPFIVMELLDGADLCQIADARGALPRWLVVDYMLQTLEGLAHAHARGIVHRDLKPSNLFLANRADGTQVIKILDFGISKSNDPAFDDTGERKRTLQLTGGRAVLGSPPYMSPEQVRSPKTVDHRTDIWSLGVVMYELLTNSMPFGGDEMSETFAQILETEPLAIRSIVDGVPEGLERIVMRCLAKNRENRFADVSELARALVAFGSGTWMQSADRVHATLTRGLEEAISGPRVKNGSQSTARGGMVISPLSGRRLDSVQSELNGTASTVARRFSGRSRVGSRGRMMLAGAGMACFASALILVGALVRKRPAEALAAPVPVIVYADPPPEATVTPVPIPSNGGGVVSRGASAGIVGAVSARKVTAASQARPVPLTPTAVRKPVPAPSAAKPLLPAGLPRDRDGR